MSMKANIAELNNIRLEQHDGHLVVHFTAMASDCMVLFDTRDRELAEFLGSMAADEVRRIERKFSRYRKFNPVHCINESAGMTVTVDDETARLLDYADLCHELSDGRFDITSGVLRHAWRFDGSSELPDGALIAELKQRVGWQRVGWKRPELRLPLGAEIDFGGIGKEYAADRVALMLSEHSDTAILVNLGGDLVARGERKTRHYWHVGVDSANPEQAVPALSLQQGALATSGDTRRYIEFDGKRYSHILDPLTGWPVENGPALVTVAAPTCMEAGMMSSLAMLMGAQAEEFLDAQNVQYWIQRR